MPKVLDPRLKIELFAAEPDIVTPTGIAVDAQGPRAGRREPHALSSAGTTQGPPADRIRMFEDTDGDGRADRITTFFEGTTWTMNVGVHPDGSVYVATRSEIFRLRDTDGDGRADERTPIVHLETKGDYPHNGLSGFAFDFDGNVYFGLGENLGAEFKLIGTDGSVAGEREGGQIYRCRADGTAVEMVAFGFWNPFHWRFDAFGRLFAVDNDPDSLPPCRLMHIVPGRQLRLSLSQRPQGRASLHGLERRAARHAADGGRHGRGALGRRGLRIGPPAGRLRRRPAGHRPGATIASSGFAWSRAARAFAPMPAADRARRRELPAGRHRARARRFAVRQRLGAESRTTCTARGASGTFGRRKTSRRRGRLGRRRDPLPHIARLREDAARQLAADAKAGRAAAGEACARSDPSPRVRRGGDLGLGQRAAILAAVDRARCPTRRQRRARRWRFADLGAN